LGRPGEFRLFVSLRQGGEGRKGGRKSEGREKGGLQTLEFELLDDGMKFSYVEMGDELLNESAIERGGVLEETSVVVYQLPVFDGS